MHSHSIIGLLRSLNEIDLKELNDFLCSPFFNKSEVLIKLFDIITKHAPDYSKPSLKKENIYKKLYPGKSYNEKTIRTRIAELSGLIKMYFSERDFKRDSFTQKKSLIKELRRTGNYEQAEKQIKDAFDYLEDIGKFDPAYFREKLEILSQYSKLKIAMDLKPDSLRSAFPRGENILNSFLIEILNMGNDIFCWNFENKESAGFDFTGLFLRKFDFEGYLETLQKNNYEHYPILAIYYYGYLSLINPGEEKYFYKLKELVFDNYKKISNEELYNYWTSLSNSAFTNYLKSGVKFLNEGQEINEFFIEKKLYDDTKHLSAMAYQNTIINALMVGKLDWAEKFADDFKKSLTDEARDNRYNYCKAMIHFDRNNFNGSIEYLSKVKNIDWHFKINVRVYYLRNYYELGYSEQVASLIDSFRHYNSKNPEAIPEYLDDRVKNFLHYVTKLAAAKFSGKKLDGYIYEEAKQKNDFIHKDWVMKKMEELV